MAINQWHTITLEPSQGTEASKLIVNVGSVSAAIVALSHSPVRNTFIKCIEPTSKEESDHFGLDVEPAVTKPSLSVVPS